MKELTELVSEESDMVDALSSIREDISFPTTVFMVESLSTANHKGPLPSTVS
jgi:hypothetical protein